MRWTRALDKLPAENQEVLVRSRTIVYLAIFDQPHRLFRLKDGKLIDPVKEDVLWMELVGSDHSHVSR
jgi:hypothetical protein